MNVDDVKDNEVPKIESSEYLDAIFAKQLTLVEKYKEIEGIPDYPFDVDSADHQIWIKDFLWRVTEELAEAMQAMYDGHKIHQIEEVVDALHFLVELFILVNMKPLDNLDTTIMNIHTNNIAVYGCKEGRFTHRFGDTVYFLGLVGNTLKNKKWKQTQMQTDVKKFESLLQEAFVNLIGVFVSMNCTSKDIYTFYFKKSEVNNFRIRTNY